jgi:glycosyltransferase involved in cell wall biosynthesis
VPACLTSGFSVLFAGNIGDAQGLDSVLAAAEILRNRSLSANIVFLGDGIAADRLKTMADKKNLRNVLFLPKVPMSIVGAYLSAAKVLLIHLRDDELFEITIPSKTQAYMAAGKPLLMAVRGDAADLVRKASCGVCVNPDDPEGLADAISKMAAMGEPELMNYGARAAKFYQDCLSVAAGCDSFAAVFRQIKENRD